jgi:membrane carboxypeptidase/penicillin-binding protein
MLPQLRQAAGGIHTMRWGLEQSRNLMTVRIANDTGMDKVVTTKPWASAITSPISLGAGRG